jgi:hypothetical protein
MELISLLERMKMEHLLAQLDGVCEHAAKGDLDYKSFLTQGLEAEWRGRLLHAVGQRLRIRVHQATRRSALVRTGTARWGRNGTAR